MKLRLTLSIVVLAIAGCAASPNIVSSAAPGVDFRQYSTYGFYDPLATDQQNYESLVSNFLKVAMAQEMDRRGLTYSDSPDLKINFYINTQERIRTRQVPTTTHNYYMYRSPYGYDPFFGYPAYETHIDQYTEGTLNIDIVDVRAGKLVWEGMASGRVRDSAVRNLEQTIDNAVSAIMEGFPR